jgi:hypothetical protein
MYESYLQLRAEEIQAEMHRDAAARRLVREARAGCPQRGPLDRLAGALVATLQGQRSASTTRATARIPSSISDVVTCP